MSVGDPRNVAKLLGVDPEELEARTKALLRDNVRCLRHEPSIKATTSIEGATIICKCKRCEQFAEFPVSGGGETGARPPVTPLSSVAPDDKGSPQSDARAGGGL